MPDVDPIFHKLVMDAILDAAKALPDGVEERDALTGTINRAGLCALGMSLGDWDDMTWSVQFAGVQFHIVQADESDEPKANVMRKI